MAITPSELQLIIRAKDEASKTLQSVMGSTNALNASLKTMTAGAGGIGDDLKQGLSSLLPGGAGVLLGGAFTAGIIMMGRETIQTVGELNTLGAQSARLSASFQTQWGEQAAGAMEKLREASKGTITDMDLTLAANRARMLKVTNDADELAALLQVARTRGQALGISSSQAFDNIVTGIGRISPLILDNLGILTGGEAAFDAYAVSIGKAAGSLNDVEKRQALVNLVISEAGDATLDAAGQQEAWAAQTANAKAQLGLLVSAMVEATGIPPALTQGVTNLTGALQGVNAQTVTIDEATAQWHATMERAKGSLNLVEELTYKNWIMEMALLYRTGVLDIDEYTRAIRRSETAMREAAGMASTATEKFQQEERAFLDAQWAANGFGTEVVKTAKESAAELARLDGTVDALKGTFKDAALSAKVLASQQNTLGVSTDTLKGKVLNLAAAYDRVKRSAWASMAAQANEGPYQGIDTSGGYEVYGSAWELSQARAPERDAALAADQQGYVDRLSAQADYASESGSLAEQQFAELRSIVESALSPTEVTAADMAATAAGAYVDKWDEYMRRVRMPGSGYDAAGIAEQERQFYSGQMMDQVNWAAVVSDVQRKVQEEAGKEAMLQEAMRQVQAAGITASQAQLASAMGITDYQGMGKEEGAALASGISAMGLGVKFTDEFTVEFDKQQDKWVTMGKKSVGWMAIGMEQGTTPQVTALLVNLLAPKLYEALMGGARP